MVPAIRSSFAGAVEGAERRETRRLILPNHRQNSLLVNGADGSQLPAVEAYKSLRTQIMKRHLGADLRSLVVTSAARADGKTVTTFNLACSCAQLEDVPVLLVDADLRSQGLTRLIGNLPGPGLGDFLSGALHCEDIAVKSNVGDLWIVGAGKNNLAPAELFSNGRWLQFVMWARKHFKLVLFDSPPVSVVTDFDLISSACDGILVVVRALKTPREDLQESLGQLDTKKVVGVVWNGTHKAANYDYR